MAGAIRRRSVALALVLGALIALPAAGCLYETVAAARDARRFPPPGRLIDVGGRRLYLVCIERGVPVVLFEASGFSNSLSSGTAREALAVRTRVCSYDRMGIGWSDPGPGAVSIGLLADDLRRLQDEGALERPLIIVTSSIGGLITELFTRRYPERVSGVVFVDAALSGMIPSVAPTLDSAKVRAGCVALAAAGRLGVVRLLDPFRLRQSPSTEAARSAALTYGAQPWVTLCALARGLTMSQQEFAEAPPLRPDIPLTVLSAESAGGLLPPGITLDASALGGMMKQAHQQLATRSARGSWQVVPGSDHLIATSRPQAVVDAVLDLLNERRAERPAPLGEGPGPRPLPRLIQRSRSSGAVVSVASRLPASSASLMNSVR